MDCRCHLTMRRSFSPQGDPPASPLVSLEIPAFLPSSSSITGPVFNAERPMFDVRRPLHDDRSPLRDVRHPVTRCQAPRYAMSGTPLRDVRHPVTRCQAPRYAMSGTPLRDVRAPVRDVRALARPSMVLFPSVTETPSTRRLSGSAALDCPDKSRGPAPVFR